MACEGDCKHTDCLCTVSAGRLDGQPQTSNIFLDWIISYFESWTVHSLQLVLHVPACKWTQGPNLQQNVSFFNEYPSPWEGLSAADRLLAPWESVRLLLLQDHEEPHSALSQRLAADSNSVACIIAVNWSHWTGRLGVYSSLCLLTQDTWLAYSACSFLACKKTHF